MKRRTRMYEPWGYRDENNYESSEIIHENDLESFFSGVNYNKDDNKIHFQNKDGEEVASLDVNEFVKSDSIIDHTEYKDGILSIYFTNGDVVNIDLTELLDENEFKDGLVVNEGVVKVLIDGESDGYLSVGENGVKVAGVKADIEAEEARATSAETALDEKIDGEIARATSAETALDTKIDDEISRANEAEAALDEKIDQEITDRTADVDAEETRATGAENALSNRVNALNDELDAEESRAQAAEQELSTRLTTEIAERKVDVDEEEARAKAAEAALQNAIDAEAARATSAETALQAAIASEGQRAQDAEAALDTKIDAEATRAEGVEAALDEKIDAEEERAMSAETAIVNAIDELDEVKADKANAVASAEYVSADTKIYFKDIDGNTISEIDASDFIKDGMISDVKIEDGKLKIIFNTDSGKEEIDIPLTDIFNPANYYDKDAIDGIVSGISEEISNEAATRAENDEALSQSIDAEKTRAEEKETALQASIETEVTTARAAEQANADAIVAEKDRAEAAEALKANSADVDAALALKADKSEIPTDFYTKGEIDGKEDALQAGIDANAEAISAEETRALSAETDLQTAIDLKADKETTYTKEEVDALLLAKENEIYNLTKIVGDMGGAVTYDLPSPAGKSFNTLMNNTGTVKLTDDVTTGRFGPGITAKNKVKLNLNNNDLTITGLTITSAQAAIMARGTQEITIYGKGTIDAGNGICVEGNGADSVINLTGSTTVYQTDRSGGELIYCYAGTINITNGTFKNNGEDKKYLLNCYDANYRAGTAKIVVTGGKFYDFNPADNSAEGEHTNFVAEGYHVEISQDGDSTVYTVKKDA